VGRARELLHKALGRGPLTGIASGTLVTVMVQSSSTTTSLMIPLAGGGVFSTRQLYPFTLGPTSAPPSPPCWPPPPSAAPVPSWR
jgi:sodium-dependent phosphate cotransporter